MTAAHRFDESDELRLVVDADSFAGVVAEAGRALAELAGTAGASSAGEWKELELEATDRAGLLVDWLNELIYRAESEGWLGVEFQVKESGPGRIQAQVRGVAWPSRTLPVKAATLGRARVEASEAGVTAELTLDV